LLHPLLFPDSRDLFLIKKSAPKWLMINDQDAKAKRRNGQPVLLEDYVQMQPPRARSIIIEPPLPEAPLTPPGLTEGKYIPVVADFLKSGQDYFGFVPRRPRSESEFKRAYAQAAKAAGITKEQGVRIYGF
jgi:hypothetical protein